MNLAKKARQPGWWNEYDDLRFSPSAECEQMTVIRQCGGGDLTLDTSASRAGRWWYMFCQVMAAEMPRITDGPLRLQGAVYAAPKHLIKERGSTR
jgi:hypothetical protein